MFSQVVKDVSASFNIMSRPKGAFNDNVDVKRIREINNIQNFRAPEVITNNMDFFESLKIVGITHVMHRIQPAFHPHNRRFHLLDGLLMRGTHLPIVKFLVPELGAQVLHTSMANMTMTYDNGTIVGSGNHLAFRAREKLDGVECVVFGVEFSTCTIFYMWDVDNLYVVNATGPAVFERVGGDLYMLSDIKDYQINIPYKKHCWQNLSQDLVNNADEGVIIGIDFDEYKVVRDPTVTLKIVDNKAFSSTNDMVLDFVDEKDGLYDVSVESGKVIKLRPDRVHPDSGQVIDVIKRCALKYEDIDKYFKLSEDRVEPPKEIRINMNKDIKPVEALNLGTVKVPNFIPRDVRKVGTSKGEYLRERAAAVAKLTVNILIFTGNFASLQFEKGMHVRDGKMLYLGYTQRNVLHPLDKSGLSAVPFSGCGCVMIDLIPDKYRPYFCYRGVYVLFFDPVLWMFPEGKPPDDGR